jgi:hypothetical protein
MYLISDQQEIRHKIFYNLTKNVRQFCDGGKVLVDVCGIEKKLKGICSAYSLIDVRPVASASLFKSRSSS